MPPTASDLSPKENALSSVLTPHTIRCHDLITAHCEEQSETEGAEGAEGAEGEVEHVPSTSSTALAIPGQAFWNPPLEMASTLLAMASNLLAPELLPFGMDLCVDKWGLTPEEPFLVHPASTPYVASTTSQDSPERVRERGSWSLSHL